VTDDQAEAVDVARGCLFGCLFSVVGWLVLLVLAAGGVSALALFTRG